HTRWGSFRTDIDSKLGAVPYRLCRGSDIEAAVESLSRDLTAAYEENYPLRKVQGPDGTGDQSQIPITAKCKVSLKNKTIMIQMVLLPIMTYAAVAWGYVSKTLNKRLQAQQNIALRETVDAPWLYSKV
ncbi:unnamed protein product, partial [Acanthoscelides obtectus]